MNAYMDRQKDNYMADTFTLKTQQKILGERIKMA